MFLTVLPARWIPSRIAASKLSDDSALISMILATDIGFSLLNRGLPDGTVSQGECRSGGLELLGRGGLRRRRGGPRRLGLEQALELDGIDGLREVEVEAGFLGLAAVL